MLLKVLIKSFSGKFQWKTKSGKFLGNEIYQKKMCLIFVKSGICGKICQKKVIRTCLIQSTRKKLPKEQTGSTEPKTRRRIEGPPGRLLPLATNIFSTLTESKQTEWRSKAARGRWTTQEGSRNRDWQWSSSRMLSHPGFTLCTSQRTTSIWSWWCTTKKRSPSSRKRREVKNATWFWTAGEPNRLRVAAWATEDTTSSVCTMSWPKTTKRSSCSIQRALLITQLNRFFLISIGISRNGA